MSRHIGEIGKEVVNTLRERQENPELYRPIPFGIERLTKAAGGIVFPSYIAIGGPAKVGKTAVALHMAHILGAAERGRTNFYSLEELEFQIGVRALTKLTVGVNRNIIRDVTVTEDHFKELDEATSKLETLDLHVDGFEVYANRIIQQAKQENAKYIVVDYLQYLEDFTNMSEVERLRAISKLFVKARNDKEKPLSSIVVYQIGDSGKADYTRSVYKDADLIIEVFPAMDYIKDEPKRGRLWLQILPSRQAESTQKIEVGFDGAHSRITDIPEIDLNNYSGDQEIEKEVQDELI